MNTQFEIYLNKLIANMVFLQKIKTSTIFYDIIITIFIFEKGQT